MAIVGVLSSTAVNQFSSVTTQSRVAVLESVSSAIDSAVTFTYLQAQLQDKMTDSSVVYNDHQVAIHRGYPIANWNQALKFIVDLKQDHALTEQSALCTQFKLCVSDKIDSKNQWLSSVQLPEGQAVVVWMNGNRLSDECFSYYHYPSSATKRTQPSTGTVTAGC